MALRTVATPEDPYDSLAPFYDALTEAHDYELWAEALLPAARSAGLHGRKLLDLGCGTAKSTEPFLRRGFEVTGVDISEPMLRVAARRAPGARFLQADMRELPELGPFDVAVCLDDGVNYMDSERDLAAFFAGVRRSLRPGGLLLFDVNTLHAYQQHFSCSSVIRCDEDLVLLWQGQTSPDLAPGEQARLTIEAFARGPGGWGRHRSVHLQRHHPDGRIRSALRRAGLDVLDVASHGFDAVLTRPADPGRHTKLIYIARRDAPAAPDPEEVKEGCSPSCTPASRWSPRRRSSRAAEAEEARAAATARAPRP